MDHPGVGSDLLIDDPSTVGLLHFLASDPEFLRFVTRVAGCPPITHFNGRVYRLVADPDVHDSWHDDLRDDTRHVALSINLGAEPYTGGLFRLRRRANEEVIAEMPNVRAGDALLFRLSPKLQHMVTPMTGGTTKTAFAGWFQSDGSSLLQSIKDRSEREHDHAAHSQ